jgi:hypothetical protein
MQVFYGAKNGGRIDSPASSFNRWILERDLASKLDDSGIIGRDDLAEGAAGNVGVRLLELGVIKDVEKLRSRLEGEAFSDLRRLD